MFFFKVGCMVSTKYFDVPYGRVPIIDTILLIYLQIDKDLHLTIELDN